MARTATTKANHRLLLRGCNICRLYMLCMMIQMYKIGMILEKSVDDIHGSKDMINLGVNVYLKTNLKTKLVLSANSF